MADGTPLEALENGSIQDAADAAKMAEIMRDINASGGGAAPPPQPQMMQSAPPMMQQMPMQMQMPMHMPMQQQQRYVPVDDDEYKPRKKNMWSNISSSLRDPVMVAILVFIVSLPVLHTQLAKVAGWAFAVGGQLSWLGLIALSLISGILFGTMKGVASLVGL